MQRKLSSFDIFVIVDEIQNLVGSNIDKTYQLTRDELLIRVKNIKTKQKMTRVFFFCFIPVFSISIWLSSFYFLQIYAINSTKSMVSFFALRFPDLGCCRDNISQKRRIHL